MPEKSCQSPALDLALQIVLTFLGGNRDIPVKVTVAVMVVFAGK